MWHHYKGSDQHDGQEYAIYYKNGTGLEGTKYVWMKKKPSERWLEKRNVVNILTFASRIGFATSSVLKFSKK